MLILSLLVPSAVSASGVYTFETQNYEEVPYDLSKNLIKYGQTVTISSGFYEGCTGIVLTPAVKNIYSLFKVKCKEHKFNENYALLVNGKMLLVKE